MRGRVTVAVLTVALTAGCATSERPDTAASEPSATATTDTPAPPPTPSATATPSPSPTPTPPPAPDPATVYAGPDELAAVLVEAEQAIRDDELPADHLEGWARVEQAVYRQLAGSPEWHDPVRATVPEELRTIFDRNLRATVELRRLTSPRSELPAWRIVAPPPAAELLDAYRTAADEFGIDWTLLAGIHLVETRMGRIRGDSTAGAKGPMQFIPSTWDAYGEGDIEDPHDAIRAAARYLADHGAPEDVDSALYAYNRSDRYVQAVKDHAAVIRDDLRAYHAYHAWQVYYRLESGDVVLEEGFDNTA